MLRWSFFLCCDCRSVCVCVCVCVLKLQVNRFPLTPPDTAVERKSDDNRWRRLSDPSLHTLSLSSGGRGYELQDPRLSGGGGRVQVGFGWGELIVDRGFPVSSSLVIGSIIGRLAFHSALPGDGGVWVRVCGRQICRVWQWWIWALRDFLSESRNSWRRPENDGAGQPGPRLLKTCFPASQTSYFPSRVRKCTSFCICICQHPPPSPPSPLLLLFFTYAQLNSPERRLKNVLDN